MQHLPYISMHLEFHDGSAVAETILRTLDEPTFSDFRPKRTGGEVWQAARERKVTIPWSSKSWLAETLALRERGCETIQLETPRRGMAPWGGSLNWDAVQRRAAGSPQWQDNFSFGKRQSDEELALFERLFEQLVILTRPVVGDLCTSEEHGISRRGSAFCLPRCLPRLVAVNWLSPFLVDWFGRERVGRLREADVQMFECGGAIIRTSSSIVEFDAERAGRVQDELNPEAFANADRPRDYEYQHPDWDAYLASVESSRGSAALR